jgi:hypothetical protein
MAIPYTLRLANVSWALPVQHVDVTFFDATFFVCSEGLLGTEVPSILGYHWCFNLL